MQRVVDFCREREMIVVHDFAYADVGFDGYRPPSILQAEGAKECAVELYSMTKSFSMAGWRCAFLLGNAEVVQALVKLKSYLDYGMFQPVQIAATVTMNEAPDFPEEVCAIYQSRRDALIDGLGRIGWDIPKPKGSMFVWAPIPEPYAEMDSVEFCSLVVRDCDVALSPGVGFGPGGEGFARFALIENEKRIAQGIRNLRKGLPSSADRFTLAASHGRDRGHGTSPSRCRHSARERCRRHGPTAWTTFVVRVWLPDRPGALGQVASRIGAVHGDVIGDRHPRARRRPGRRRARRRRARVGRPSTCWPRRSAPSTGSPSSTSAPSATIARTRRRPCCSWPLPWPRRQRPNGWPRWSAGLMLAADGDWAVAVRDYELIEQCGTPPDLGWLLAFLDGSEHLDPACPANAPGDVMWARLPATGTVVATGRGDRAVHERERSRGGAAGAASSTGSCSQGGLRGEGVVAGGRGAARARLAHRPFAVDLGEVGHDLVERQVVVAAALADVLHVPAAGDCRTGASGRRRCRRTRAS